ncbi:hypothetical protein A3715_06775 [Oleiphilus sp. HI0009]|uniref:GNAT family N-acetyltransferase n=1 Tax=unclassified Oleiphilus TaxID=2631174 RepID=UPI0007C32C0F|nr:MULTISPECIES: GNAT family N-acetyltransferase [unclassified Oleiphilus]KZX76201.1 hypothetical protein A3715_22085 [Oleiphilus sp. HI0009]MCH2158641.1 GNAT family N-acetyltransferase [Oleiphilaceae bacterium]KZX81700.1 hypothetical protein A3715_06775 [Oleiphilus sp. HI0009]KZY66553.1 hypothetical protein A3738_06210 [Oleiphilus sp. HI0066]KZY69610.1 hypothetical protein A3739_08690 [Oleiphilus sp. HI0067]
MEEIVYYLEMHTPPAYVMTTADSEYVLEEVKHNQAPFNQFLYSFVGKAWDWTDRLVWTDQQWFDLVNDPNLRTWVAYRDGAILGYFELRKDGSNVELLYFGLSPDFIGKGFGTAFLEDAVRQAWSWDGVERVWVHTCNFDHPAALDNYKRRGFVHYKTV